MGWRGTRRCGGGCGEPEHEDGRDVVCGSRRVGVQTHVGRDECYGPETEYFTKKTTSFGIDVHETITFKILTEIYILFIICP